MNKLKSRIADAMNTYNPALAIIKSKGYKLFLFPDERKGFLGNYYAIKNEKDFFASDPLRLLGLIIIWEKYGDNWQEAKGQIENIDNEIMIRTFPELTDIEKLTQKEFDKYVSDYRIFFHYVLNKKVLPEYPTRKEFFDIINSFYKEEID